MLLVPSHMEVIKEGVVSSKNALNISRTRACVQIHKHHVSEKGTLLPQCENFVICLATK